MLVVYGGNDGIGGATAELASKYGDKVFRFSHSYKYIPIAYFGEPNDMDRPHTGWLCFFACYHSPLIYLPRNGD